MTTGKKAPASGADVAVDQQTINVAAAQGYCVRDEEVESGDVAEDQGFEMFGDIELLTDVQKASFRRLKEASKYPRFKVKRVSLSFSGASVFFMTPFRSNGVPMPASVLKFDAKECVEDEMEKTRKFRLLFGSTTPEVKDFYLDDSKDPSSVMQIDLCGGVFGLPEFAKAPPVHTFASILEAELKEASMTVDVIPIINEALERRMYHFTMSSRDIKPMSLADSYKIVRFVGHGILNRAKEGAKRAAKSPALAAGFQNPVEIDDLDPDGKIIQELCGRKQTVRDLFQNFTSREAKLSEKYKRNVVVGLCHNDLHGGNLLVDSQGLVWLIDFATVEAGKHVLMDLSKFLSAVTFMYMQDSVNEDHIRCIAKVLSTTPDATTDMPLAILDQVREDPVAKLYFQILARIRHCMCLFESGTGGGENDGCPFAIALFAWSARMQSYSEPTLFQKTRALYFAVAGMQRLLWQMGEDVGPTATKWIEEGRGMWEGQKGRRLSTSVAAERIAVPAYEFALEFQTYCAQAGSTEAWTTDILTREKVNVTEHCTQLSLSFQGSLNTRLVLVPERAKILWAKVEKVYKLFAKDLLEMELFCGRTVVVGDGGTGKSVLTKQLFAELAQMEVKDIRERTEAEHEEKAKNKEQGQDKEEKKEEAVAMKPQNALVPLRVPLVDISRQLEEMPDSILEPDILNDILAVWAMRHYGKDSSLAQLIGDVRQASLEEEEEEEEAQEEEGEKWAMGLFLLLDGLDEASAKRTEILQFIGELMEVESCHYPLLTSRPGVLGYAEDDALACMGFVACLMSNLPPNMAQQLAMGILVRSGESEALTKRISETIQLPAYSALTANPMCVTLLTHVLRKFQKDTGDGVAQTLSKTEVYQRALKLMMHQADASKFVSRDGEADLLMVKRLELLKSAKSRLFFQTMAWQVQCERKRTITIGKAKALCDDEDILSAFIESISNGRLPAYSVVGGAAEDLEIQLVHLSFQELLVAEYTTAVLQYSRTTGGSQQMKPYLNFLTSTALAAQSRDRLAEQWWLQIWFNVSEMLGEDSFKNFCHILAADDRAKLKPGRISFTTTFLKIKEEIAKHMDRYAPKDVPYPTRAYRVNWMDMKTRMLTLVPTERHLIATMCGQLTDIAHVEPLPFEAGRWFCEGIGTVAAAAARKSDWRMIQEFLRAGLHNCICDKAGMSIQYACLSNSDWTGTHLLSEANADINFVQSHILMNPVIRGSARYNHAESAALQAPFPAAQQLFWEKASFRGQILAAYEGTLQVGPELDANFYHMSGMTLLMCAAAGGHSRLVASLLAKRARANARSCENCTALCFALDCAQGPEGKECVRVLLEGKADPNIKCGVVCRISVAATGTNVPCGASTAMACDHGMFDLLLKHGYDPTMCGDTGLSILFWASNASISNPDKESFVSRLLDLKCSYDEPLTKRRGKLPRIAAQHPFGPGLQEAFCPDPMTLLEYLTFCYHSDPKLCKFWLDRGCCDIHANHEVAQFKSDHKLLLFAFLSARDPAILKGEVSLLNFCHDRGMDWLSHCQTCDCLLFRLYFNADREIPYIVWVHGYQYTCSAFFHAVFNKALADIPFDEKKQPRYVKTMLTLNTPPGNIVFLNAYTDWQIGRKLASRH